MVNELVALIAEGSAEQAILDVLLDNNLLIFAREELLQEKVLRTRKASAFEKQYMGMSFDKQVVIYRVLDSKNESFKLSKANKTRISDVRNIYTRPEIEMLYIVYYGKYDEYSNKHKSKEKPSEFVKNELDLSNVKSYQTVYDFWLSKPEALVTTIRTYASLSSIDIENTLIALLKG